MISTAKITKLKLDLHGVYSNSRFSECNILNDYLIIKLNALTFKIPLKIPNFGIIPEGKQGLENKPWTFIDEIIIKKYKTNLKGF